jgi:hypothetical protein
MNETYVKNTTLNVYCLQNLDTPSTKLVANSASVSSSGLPQDGRCVVDAGRLRALTLVKGRLRRATTAGLQNPS